MRNIGAAVFVLALLMPACLQLKSKQLSPPKVTVEGIWRTNSRLQVKSSDPCRIRTAQYSPTGSWIALQLVPDEGRFVVAALDLKALTLQTRSSSSAGALFSPNEDLLAFQDSLDSVCLWALPNSIRKLPLLDSGVVEHLLFSPSGQYLVGTQAERRVSVWRVKDQQLLTTFDTNGESIQRVVFEPQGRAVLVLSEVNRQNRLSLYETQSGNRIAQTDLGEIDPSDLCFSRDGRTIFALSDQGVHQWRASGLQVGRRFPRPTPPDWQNLFDRDDWTRIGPSQGNQLAIQAKNSTLLLDTNLMEVTCHPCATAKWGRSGRTDPFGEDTGGPLPSRTSRSRTQSSPSTSFGDLRNLRYRGHQ
jgi:WD40 repeat protein